MPALHQEPGGKDVVEQIKEVLAQRIGADRFGLWFAERVQFQWEAAALVLRVQGEFALERLRGKYLRAVESAAAEVLRQSVPVRLELADSAMLAFVPPAAVFSAEAAVPAIGSGKELSSAAKTLAKSPAVTEESTIGSFSRRTGSNRGLLRADPAPFADLVLATAAMPRSISGLSTNHAQASRATTAAASTGTALPAAALPGGTGGRMASRAVSVRVTSPPAAAPVAAGVGALQADSAANGVAAEHPGRPAQRDQWMTFGTFVTANSNTLATTAARLLAANPASAAPLCFWGATGTGKTHLLSAIQHELRGRHRLPRVILMSAEEFTNDFLSCVRGTGLPAFRKRYRDVDALLIDNVQFLGGKSATLREMLYTVDTVLSRGRPLVLAGDRQPLEIEGLSGELAGRMSSGLVCGINPMELELRRELYCRHAQRSFLPWDDATIDMLAERTVGDGRVIQGISQLVSMLQRMYRRMPSFAEITSHAGDMLQRGPKVVALADVERAVCSAFGLSVGELKGESKSRNVSQPRILAMYLSRQHTTAAFAEIGRYYGDRNHSTVIAAHRRVERWLKENQRVGGRGPKNMKAHEAIAAVENLLRIG